MSAARRARPAPLASTLLWRTAVALGAWLALLLPSSAGAQPVQLGGASLGQLADACRSSAPYDLGWCAAYVNAIADTLLEQPARARADGTCLEKPTNQQLIDAVLQEVARDPAARKQPPATGTLRAFRAAFPCDPRERAEVQRAQAQRVRRDFLEACARVPLRTKRAWKDVCECAAQEAQRSVDWSSSSARMSVEGLRETSAAELDAALARFRGTGAANPLEGPDLAPPFLRALARCSDPATTR